jgi:DNA-binding response OmpR family regulator
MSINAPAPSAADKPTGSAAPFDILVVEDDPRIARLVQTSLQKMKMQCRLAADGKSALAAIAQKTPHLVLLDLTLPDMTGYEICAKIRATEGPGSRIPIIMVTARDEADDQLHGLKVGADDYVTKPFDPKLLMARVAAQLRRAHHYSAEVVAPPSAPAKSSSPPGWTRCEDCNYLGPNKKFEEINEQRNVVMVCPHCGTQIKQDYVLG